MPGTARRSPIARFALAALLLVPLATGRLALPAADADALSRWAGGKGDEGGEVEPGDR